MSANPVRIQFATSITNECLKNPELTTNLISIVADECSNEDLIRIHKIFFESLKTVNDKGNLKN